MSKKNKTRRRLHRLVFAFAAGILSLVTGITSFAMISYSGYVIYDSLYTNEAAFSSWDLSEYRPVLKENGELSFEELLDVNPDTVGWITIQGTNIDYPIMQGKDDLEYASKDVFGKSSLSGSIYLTTANTRDFTNSFNLIYGHHMDNGAMFGDIEKYADYDYFHAHQDGIVITTQGIYDIKIFARIGTDAYDSRIYSAGDRKSEDFPDFLEYVHSLAIQWQDGTDVYDITDHVRTYLLAREENIQEYGHFVWGKMPRDAIENGMQLLALSTCADATTNGRQLLFATMKIRTEPLPEEVIIPENRVPLSVMGHGQGEYWGLINLLCLIAMAVTILPGLLIPSKYGLPTYYKKARPEETTEQKRMRLRFTAGTIAELVIFAAGLIAFVLTENLHRHVAVTDEWTLLMLGLLTAMVAAEYLFFHARKKEIEPRIETESAM